ncbi:MAG: type II toxin-antitoxin system HicB family antitoxin [Patescibacteria group bacterium]
MNRKSLKILSYNAIFTPNEQKGFNVSFPDFPGCVTFGNSFEEAKKYAREALELWIAELNQNRENIPRESDAFLGKINVKVPVFA